ncbi:MAG: lactate utilization protein C, partial [Caldilineaceae bacterium]|nr:lactate utilization protein C [Caldilineaceae bacterium]
SDLPTEETRAESYATAIDRSYRHRDDRDREQIIHDFIERVTEYKATVRRVREAELATKISETLAGRGVQRLVVPIDLPTAWQPTEITLLTDSGDLSYDTLGASDGVLTGCAVGIAQTGTIVMDHSTAQGRRAISLVPDYHLCIVREDQIVGLVPEGIDALTPAVRNGRPITFISGPSATSDIELNRVEGVHGPRTLDVLVVGV